MLALTQIEFHLTWLLITFLILPELIQKILSLFVQTTVHTGGNCAHLSKELPSLTSITLSVLKSVIITFNFTVVNGFRHWKIIQYNTINSQYE